MSDDKSAIVVGGSLAGLFCALILSRIGWRVRVYERDETYPAPRHVPVPIMPELRMALQAAGAGDMRSLGVRTTGVRHLSAEGAIARESGEPRDMTDWSRLLGLLREAASESDIRYGIRVTGADARAGRVHFADGSKDQADLVIAADGALSAVRNAVLPATRVQYAGYVAWSGRVDVATAPEAWRETLAGSLVRYEAPGTRVDCTPLPGPDGVTAPEKRRLAWVWYRPVPADALKPLLTDRRGAARPQAVPPGQVPEAAWHSVREEAGAALPPPLADLVRASRTVAVQAVADVSAQQLVIGRTVLVGDAAFALRPHTGFGATKAAADALLLAHSLMNTDQLDAALRDWTQSQRPYGTALVTQGQQEGCALLG